MDLIIAVAAVGLLGILALAMAALLHIVDPTRAAISGEVARRGVTIRFVGRGLYAAFLTVFLASLVGVYLLVR